MSKINPTQNLLAYQVVNPLKDFKANDSPKILPMPDWHLRKFNEYEAMPRYEHAKDLYKDIMQRFPSNPKMPGMHPAYTAFLKYLIPKLFPQLSPMDNTWHREVLRRARIREELHRIEIRSDTNQLEQLRYELRTQLKEAKLSAFYFERTKERMIKQSMLFNKLKLEATDEDKRMQEFLYALRDKRRMQEFLFFMLKYLSPTMRVRSFLEHKAKTEPSLTEARLAQSIAVTPMELILAGIKKRLPFVKLDLAKAELDKYAMQLARVYTVNSKFAEVSNKIESEFFRVFVHHSDRRKLERAENTAAAFSSEDTRVFYLQRHIDESKESFERAEKFAEGLQEDRTRQSHAMDHLHFESHVYNVHMADRAYKKAEFAHRDRFVPVSILGTTDYVQLNPIKFRSQYSLIAHWVSVEESFVAREATVTNDLYNQKHIDDRKQVSELRNDVRSAAKELYRIREAQKERDFWNREDIKQVVSTLMNSVSLREKAVKALISYEQTIDSRVAKNEEAATRINPTPDSRKV